MTVEAIIEEIDHLSQHEKKLLFERLDELKEEAWDREIERDFAPGGRGEHLIAKIGGEIDQAIANGTLTSFEQGLRARRQARAMDCGAASVV